MNQRTRNIIANLLLGVAIFILGAFLARQFMAPPRPAWTKEYTGLALISAIASGLVRGRRWVRPFQRAD
ncbi:MAG TPA: hypothetical protein VN706_15555 [Gemmatimonadaceae bacterium]|nr:hypothetical protein [Gemmatimonadaceae bacterium]